MRTEANAGTIRPDLARAQAALFTSLAARDALIDKVVGFGTVKPKAAQEKELPIGIHPFQVSVESQAHWENATDLARTNRAREGMTIGQTDIVTDNLTPLFENGTPRILDRLGNFLRRAATPTLVTAEVATAGGAAGAIVMTLDQQSRFNQDAPPSAVPSAQPSEAPASLEPSPVPSGEPIDPCNPPIGDPGVPQSTEVPPVIMAEANTGETIFDDSNIDPDKDDTTFDEAAADITPEEPEDIDIGAAVDPEDPNCLSPEPSTDPKPSLTPEEIAKLVEKYNIENFIKLKDPALDDAGFKRIIKRAAPAMAEWLGRHGEFGLTPEKIIEKDIAYLEVLKQGWEMDWAGFRVVGMSVGMMENAQKAAREGNFVAAKAFMDKAEAYIRIGKTNIKFKKSPSELDDKIRQEAERKNLN